MLAIQNSAFFWFIQSCEEVLFFSVDLEEHNKDLLLTIQYLPTRSIDRDEHKWKREETTSKTKLKFKEIRKKNYILIKSRLRVVAESFTW